MNIFQKALAYVTSKWLNYKPLFKIAIFGVIDGIVKPYLINILKTKKQEVISTIQNFSEEESVGKGLQEIKDVIDRQL